MSKQILRNHSQDKDCGHATVDLQFARAFGFFDMPERVGSPKFQFIRRHHAAWDGEQSGYSRHGAEGYHEHFSGLPQVFHFGDDHFGEPEAVGDFGMDGWWVLDLFFVQTDSGNDCCRNELGVFASAFGSCPSGAIWR
jgi:hypothetical protein